MAKKERKVATKTSVAEKPSKELYEVRHIENVSPDEVDQLIVEEQQTNPRFLWAEKLPEGDGEYTVVLVYRRTSSTDLG